VSTKVNPLTQSDGNLSSGADASARRSAGTQAATPARAPTPTAAALSVGAQAGARPPGCAQCITVGFFFDGTGNNMDADTPNEEHSNVARLFRAHPVDDIGSQTYRRYIPGIGTYFQEVGDPGGTTTGRGMGAYGQARLDWAFKELGTLLRAAEARAANPGNRITALRISVFGFSRGAALARAFCRDLQNACSGTRGSYQMRSGALAGSGIALRGGYPVEVYFLGIFDTVASVGLPLSANNIRIKRQNGVGWRDFLGDGGYGRAEADLRLMAFGQRGADPAPGSADGHGAWANGLQIADIVQRCVHMVAAHEMRNSFPLDSALQGTAYPSGTVEVIHPGVHSDVGGGYRRGEGGKSDVLARVPLRAMLEEAVAAKVPLIPLSGSRSTNEKKDFSLDPEGSRFYDAMLSLWREYMRAIPGGTPLGTGVLAHMAVYWRYRLTVAVERSNPANAARNNRREQRPRTLTPDQQQIERNEAVFGPQREALVREARLKQRELSLISARREAAERSRAAARGSTRADQRELMAYWDHEVENLRVQEAAAADAARSAQARADTAANDSGLIESLDGYDGWLLQDAELLHRWRREQPNQRMRPHYAAIADAYQEVVVDARPMPSTSAAYRLFTTHVHDSLSGFAQDNTRPSDPRVIYIGGDTKKDYAALPGAHRAVGMPA
jgi:hypothetical protein